MQGSVDSQSEGSQSEDRQSVDSQSEGSQSEDRQSALSQSGAITPSCLLFFGVYLVFLFEYIAKPSFIPRKRKDTLYIVMLKLKCHMFTSRVPEWSLLFGSSPPLPEHRQARPPTNRLHPQQQRIRVHLQLRVHRGGRRLPRLRGKGAGRGWQWQ